MKKALELSALKLVKGRTATEGRSDEAGGRGLDHWAGLAAVHEGSPRDDQDHQGPHPREHPGGKGAGCTGGCGGLGGSVGGVGQGGDELAHRRESVARDLLECPDERRLDVGWDGGAHRSNRAGSLGQHPDQHAGGRLAVERWLSPKHLVEDGCKGIDVRPVIRNPVGPDLLRAHVVRRAETDPRLGQALGVRRAQGQGNAEVRDLGLAARKEDVPGLDVPMHDPPVVGGLERASHLLRQVQCFFNREGAFPIQLCP